MVLTAATSHKDSRTDEGGGEEGTEISVPHAVRAFLLKICHKFIAFAREFTVPTPTRPVANGGGGHNVARTHSDTATLQSLIACHVAHISNANWPADMNDVTVVLHGPHTLSDLRFSYSLPEPPKMFAKFQTKLATLLGPI